MTLQNGGPLKNSIGSLREWRDKNHRDEYTAALERLDADMSDEGTVFRELQEGARSGNSYDYTFHLSSDLGLTAGASQDDFLKMCQQFCPAASETIDKYHEFGYKIAYSHSPNGGKLILSY